jgi:hypothetical protein
MRVGAVPTPGRTEVRGPENIFGHLQSRLFVEESVTRVGKTWG